MRDFIGKTINNLLSLDANYPAAICTQHSVSSNDPGVNVHKARYLGASCI